jgi:UDP-glucose 4-epimerase
MDLWVIGAGGLLGSAMIRNAPPSVRVFPAPRVPWLSAVDRAQSLRASLVQFHRWRRPAQPWGIVWAAGAGVIASSPEQLATEGETLLNFAQQVAEAREDQGAFLFASSASVFGGSGALVANEETRPIPMNDYARAKLTQERALQGIFHGSTSLITARISTLYGPGQNAGKPQGLISAMCREALSRNTISVFVPIDTTRDYLYADDAARQCLHLLGVASTGQPRAMTRVVASHRTNTIGEVARLVQAVTRRRTPILQVPSAAAVGHARSLALTSGDPVLRAFPTTPLPVGIHAVYRDLFERRLPATLEPHGIGGAARGRADSRPAASMRPHSKRQAADGVSARTA